MIWLLALTAGITAAAGVYLMLSRDLLRCVLGLAILGSATSLALIGTGRLDSTAPPVVPAGGVVLEAAANPLPQALVLTAIVIGLALLCFSLVLLLSVIQRADNDDALALRAAEPPPTDAVKPALPEPRFQPDPHGRRERAP
jgi:multicomponent Na+:H+ antiporter subunit C